MKLLLVLIVFSLNFSAFALSSEFIHKPWDMLGQVKVKKQDLVKHSQILSLMGLDIAGLNHREGIIDIFLSDVEYKLLINAGYIVDIKEVHGVTSGPDPKYKTPEEIEAILKRVNAQNPEITKLVSVGKSLEGRDIWALKISDNASSDESVDEPAVLFNSMHHAREVMTPEVGLDIIDQLIAGYTSKDAQVTRWVEGLEIWVMPMFNVDGNNKMWNQDRWWRKNTRGGHGVDINRNYPTTWNTCNGSSGFPYSQTYRGSSAGSEPETKVMMKFVEQVRPVFNISYHAYSEIVIYPFGCSSNRTPTKNVVETIGKEIGQKVGYEAGTPWELLYDVDGGDIDWMYNAFGVIPYVIEVNSSREGFQPDYDQWRDVTVERNRAGWQHLLDKSFDSAIRGVLNGKGGRILDYSVKVYHEGEFLQNMKSTKSGAFHVVLSPGKYSLQFISKDNKLLSQKDIAVGDSLVYLQMDSEN